MKAIKLYLIVIAVLFSGCRLLFDREDNTIELLDIKIINNSDSEIYYLFSNLPASDTSLYTSLPFDTLDLYLINKKSYLNISPYKYGKVDLLGNSLRDYPHLFIFSKYTIDNVSWDTVVKKYMILKRYDLTLDEIQHKNWTITYP